LRKAKFQERPSKGTAPAYHLQNDHLANDCSPSGVSVQLPVAEQTSSNHLTEVRESEVKVESQEDSSQTPTTFPEDEDDEPYVPLSSEEKRSQQIGDALDNLIHISSLQFQESETEESLILEMEWTDEVVDPVGEASRNADCWTKAVRSMRAARFLKERYIRSKPRPVDRLDECDGYERRACGVLYGAFLFLMGQTRVPMEEVFDKDECDDEMEARFGSIDHRASSQLSKNEARILFSKYLSRKVWVPSPWTKLLSALDGFYSRVCDNPIEEPVDVEAREIALRILHCLIDGVDFSEFKNRQYAPDGACLERSRMEGGKRLANFLGMSPSTGNYVQPCAIYTGGKIRVVTVDSCENVDLVWVNKFIGSQFKKLKCSVFGGDVEDWWNKIGGLRKEKDSDFYVSGDLESATDNFDGRITEALIDEFCWITEFSEGKRMKKITTRAVLDKKLRWLQNRGQLMGSVISFPFLCILSLTAYLITMPEKWRRRFLSGRGSRKMLLRLEEVGINGDDVAFTGDEQKIARWVSGVKAIGGKVSRGKTLVNKDFFTINSELWSTDGKVNCLRPSLLTALTGDNRYYISPSREWKEYTKCCLPKAERVWNLVEKLNLDIPVQLGGLGLIDGRSSKAGNSVRNDLALKAFQERLYHHFVRSRVESEKRRPLICSEEGRLERKNLQEQILYRGPMRRCFISKNMKDAWAKRFNSQYSSWHLTPSEHQMCLRYLRNPEMFPVESRALEPFFDELVKTEPRVPKVKDFGKEAVISELMRNYDTMMLGYRETRLPEELLVPFNARMTELDSLIMLAEREFDREMEEVDKVFNGF